MKKLPLVLAALGSLFLTGALSAQEWPARPIKLIVPTGAGTGTDVMARLMANEVAKSLKGSIFVENIAGASGIPAHRAAASADADGYTFLFTNTSGIALNPVTFKSLPYDPAKDFAAVAMVADLAPQLVSVHKDLPVKTLPELIAYAKANPGKLDYAVDVTAGASPISARLLNDRSGAKMTEVPYRAAAQMVQDAAAGRVPVLVTSIAASRPFLETGDLRAIAVFSSRRFPTLPNVPTVAETLPNTILDGFFAVVAPVGTPANIVSRFNQAVGEFLSTADAPKRLADVGAATSGAGTPESTAKYIATEQQNWRELAKELKIEPQ